MKLFLSKDAQLKKFLKTLKIHNKDLGICFNDHLAVFHLEKLIHSAVEEARKDTLKWVLDEIRINEGSSSPKADLIKQVKRKLLGTKKETKK